MLSLWCSVRTSLKCSKFKWILCSSSVSAGLQLQYVAHFSAVADAVHDSWSGKDRLVSQTQFAFWFIIDSVLDQRGKLMITGVVMQYRKTVLRTFLLRFILLFRRGTPTPEQCGCTALLN